ncbi:MAG: uracil phosphoribosyltransferase [Bacteroidia bacterium]|nr:uracil phosphoribosyltransferase [Bacteroidia bacterium]
MDKKLFVADRQNSIFNQIMSELRDEVIQQDRARFRRNIERASQILAYEMSKEFVFESREVTTPLGTLDMNLPSRPPVIISVLRAGVPMHNGLLETFDRADSGFVSAYRYHTKGNEFIVKVEYLSSPSLEGRTLILADPMVATGKSMVLSYETLVDQYGVPDQTFIAGIIGSEQGVDYVRRKVPSAHLYIGSIDKELTAKAYIVPGLGDAGDLAFGSKS